MLTYPTVNPVDIKIMTRYAHGYNSGTKCYEVIISSLFEFKAFLQEKIHFCYSKYSKDSMVGELTELSGECITDILLN